MMLQNPGLFPHHRMLGDLESRVVLDAAEKQAKPHLESQNFIPMEMLMVVAVNEGDK